MERQPWLTPCPLLWSPLPVAAPAPHTLPTPGTAQPLASCSLPPDPETPPQALRVHRETKASPNQGLGAAGPQLRPMALLPHSGRVQATEEGLLGSCLQHPTEPSRPPAPGALLIPVSSSSTIHPTSLATPSTELHCFLPLHRGPPDSFRHSSRDPAGLQATGQPSGLLPHLVQTPPACSPQKCSKDRPAGKPSEARHLFRMGTGRARHIRASVTPGDRHGATHHIPDQC